MFINFYYYSINIKLNITTIINNEKLNKSRFIVFYKK